MKIGQSLAVQIDGIDVAEAVIEDIEDGNAIIVIPATRLVVQIKQSLDVAATATPEVDRDMTSLVEGPGSEESEAAREVNGDVGEGIHNKDLDSSAID